MKKKNICLIKFILNIPELLTLSVIIIFNKFPVIHLQSSVSRIGQSLTENLLET